MKSIKYLAVLACMTLGLADVAKAQVYNNEVMFFYRTDDNRNEDERSILVVRFDGQNAYKSGDYSRGYFSGRLQISENYFNGFPREVYGPISNASTALDYYYIFDSSITTSKRKVYECNKTVGRRGNHFYIAISTDLTSLIYYETQDKGGSSTITKTTYYSRVDKKDLLPKNVVPDFLNE